MQASSCGRRTFVLPQGGALRLLWHNRDMSESEHPPLIIPRNFDDYLDNAHKRTREEDMTTAVNYSFIAELVASNYGGVGEFQAKLARVTTNEMGKTSLLLCLIDTDTNDSLIFLDSTSEDGYITPNNRRRITHNRFQNIGTVSEGYLLGPDTALAPTTLHQPEDLVAHASWAGPRDTRTGVLRLSGIELGNN